VKDVKLTALYRIGRGIASTAPCAFSILIDAVPSETMCSDNASKKVNPR
jgi:hypothetical protein